MDITVSVVTPTYNRRRFIPTLIQLYRNQTYPKEKMEWIILDDGRDKVADLFQEAAKTIPNLRYIPYDEKLRIGAKRNRLNQEANGSIIVAMDDDDYYPADRIKYIVQTFTKHPNIDLIGSSEMYMYYTDQKIIYSIGPFHPNHATNGTMAWRKRYADTHQYDEYVTKAEEVSFLDQYKHKMIQMDPKKAILVICHTDNTVDKQQLREEHRQTIKNTTKMKETTYRLEDIVKEADIRTFYQAL